MGFADLELLGAKELEENLGLIEKKLADKIVRKSLRVGAKIIQKEMKQQALNRVGGFMGAAMWKAIKIRAIKRKRRRKGLGVMVIFSGKVNDIFIHITKAGKRHFIPAALEYGHGRNKESNAKHYMEIAWNTKKKDARDAVLKIMKTELDKEAEKVFRSNRIFQEARG